MTAPSFYTVAEVAEILADTFRINGGVAGEARVRRLIRCGQLRAVSVSSTRPAYRIPREEVERLTAELMLPVAS